MSNPDVLSKTRRRSPNLLQFWFGLSDPVRPLPYAASGFGLMLLKYAIEATFIWNVSNHLLLPWEFVSPLLTVREKVLTGAPHWAELALFIWTIPFVWIAVSMSVRRAADAGMSPWVGLVMLIPFFNLFGMIGLCLIPSNPEQQWSPSAKATTYQGRTQSAISGVGIALLIGTSMMLLSAYALGSYGGGLFVGTPIIMGAAAAYIHNRSHSRTYGESIGLGLLTIFFGFAFLLLFAAEGIVCIFMAAPLVLPLGAIGGAIGKAIADSTRRSHRGIIATVFALPLLTGMEAILLQAPEYEVMTAVEIDAPPEVVWDNVIDFPDLTEKPAWYFRMGIACPQRARIVGQGVGATRFCEFTTGTFVEPITVWDAPRRLAFDVTDQPAPMFELSPYQNIHPPHLEGNLRSNHGEFLLVRLPGNRTRLEGRTWYEVDMFPQAYWTLWSDMLIHRIHLRVLEHVKRLSE